MPVHPDGPWTVSTGTYDGRPIVVRINAGAARLADDGVLPHRLGIAVPLKHPNADGFPDADESADLIRIEDSLCAVLEGEPEAVKVLVITTSGMREFVFYTARAEVTVAAVLVLKAAATSHELQTMMEHDPSWDVYRQFVSG